MRPKRVSFAIAAFLSYINLNLKLPGATEWDATHYQSEDETERTEVTNAAQRSGIVLRSNKKKT